MVQYSNHCPSLVEVVPCSDWIDFKTRWRAVLGEKIASEKLYRRYVFRGQACSSWKLTSSFDRKYGDLRGRQRSEFYDNLLRMFGKNLVAFADRDANILLGRPADVAEKPEELEVLAQHHGLPTRLLDWSLSAYVAAFFAFAHVLNCNTGLVSVWALDSNFIKNEIDSDHLELLEDFYPKNNRQLWQLGVFVRNKTQIVDLCEIFSRPDAFIRDCAVGGPPALYRFDIPVDGREAALDDLEMMRINSISLFPGIEGVVRWLETVS